MTDQQDTWNTVQDNVAKIRKALACVIVGQDAIIEQMLFALLCRDVDLLPGKYLRRAKKLGVARSVGDYMAGMTDRFALGERERLK